VPGGVRIHFLFTKYRTYRYFITYYNINENYYNYNIQKYSVQNNNILPTQFEDIEKGAMVKKNKSYATQLFKP